MTALLPALQTHQCHGTIQETSQVCNQVPITVLELRYQIGRLATLETSVLLLDLRVVSLPAMFNLKSPHVVHSMTVLGPTEPQSTTTVGANGTTTTAEMVLASGTTHNPEVVLKSQAVETSLLITKPVTPEALALLPDLHVVWDQRMYGKTSQPVVHQMTVPVQPEAGTTITMGGSGTTTIMGANGTTEETRTLAHVGISGSVLVERIKSQCTNVDMFKAEF